MALSLCMAAVLHWSEWGLLWIRTPHRVIMHNFAAWPRTCHLFVKPFPRSRPLQHDFTNVAHLRTGIANHQFNLPAAAPAPNDNKSAPLPDFPSAIYR